MTVTTGSSTGSSTGSPTADRQRARAARATKTSGNRMPAPPRQRRPALAAIALLLIVGGALVAGLLAVRMDSRVSVLAARTDLAPGHRITATDLAEVQVASENLPVIGARYARQVVGTYAKGTIYRGTLISSVLVTSQSPVGDGRVLVSVGLNPALTPRDLAEGDLVQVIRASGGGSSNTGSGAKDVTRGLVTRVSGASEDTLGGSSTGSVNLLVPASAGKDVVDASNSSVAGLALISRGNSTDVIAGD